EVIARVDQGVSRVIQPLRRIVLSCHRLHDRQLAEDRRALEVLAAAAGAYRDFIQLMERNRKTARLAPKTAGSCERPRCEPFHSLSSDDRADDNEEAKGLNKFRANVHENPAISVREVSR